MDTGNNVLKRYIDFTGVIGTLKNGLRFSDGINWIDKNDVYDITKYNEMSNDKLLLLCFCDGAGSIYHWGLSLIQSADKVLDYHDVRCCMEFDKGKLTKKIHELGLDLKSAQYCTFDEIKNKSIADLPYLKRIEYSIEKECRVVCQVPKDFQEYKYITDIKDCLNKVTIGQCTPEQYAKIKIELLEYLTEEQIKENLFLESPKWTKCIDNAFCKRNKMRID